jgi:hypothetical protein
MAIAALLVYGFAPGLLLRLIVRAFHPEDPRREELLAELHAVPRLERPFWVLEQLEVAITRIDPENRDNGFVKR